MVPVIFWIAAVWTVLTSLAVISARNPVHSAVALVADFVGLGVLFLHAEFLAVVEILVYAGAVMVLFLFVITLLMAGTRPPAEGRGTNLPGQAPVAVALAVVLLGFVVYLVTGPRWLSAGARVSQGFGSIASFGLALFTRYLLPFELTALVLLVAIVGVVVLVREHRS
jgi:NADH-quinone oxidoreductase subunit J